MAVVLYTANHLRTSFVPMNAAVEPRGSRASLPMYAALAAPELRSASRIAVEESVQNSDRQHDGKPDLDNGDAVEICPAARAQAGLSREHRAARFA